MPQWNSQLTQFAVDPLCQYIGLVKQILTGWLKEDKVRLGRICRIIKCPHSHSVAFHTRDGYILKLLLFVGALNAGLLSCYLGFHDMKLMKLSEWNNAAVCSWKEQNNPVCKAMRKQESRTSSKHSWHCRRLITISTIIPVIQAHVCERACKLFSIQDNKCLSLSKMETS